MNSPSRRPVSHLRAVASSEGHETDDQEIYRAFSQGDPKFGQLIYDRLIRTIDGTLCRVLGEKTPEHEDLVQTVFEQIVRTCSRKKLAQVTNLKGWAAAIAVHVALNAIRSRKVDRKYFDRGPTSTARDMKRSVEGDSEGSVLLTQIRRELLKMNPERAQAVILHDVLGHELTEMALLTGVSVAATQSRLVRGRKELRSRLKELGLLPNDGIEEVP